MTGWPLPRVRVLQVRRPAADCGPGAVSAVSSNSGRRNILLFTREANFYIDVHLYSTQYLEPIALALIPKFTG